MLDFLMKILTQLDEIVPSQLNVLLGPVQLAAEVGSHLVGFVKDVQPVRVRPRQLILRLAQNVIRLSDLSLLAPINGCGDTDAGDGEEHSGGDRPANSPTPGSPKEFQCLRDFGSLLQWEGKLNAGKFLLGCRRDQGHLLAGTSQLGLAIAAVTQMNFQRAAVLSLEQVI